MAPLGLDDSTIPDLSEGALLAGRYRIVKPLGQGGMAQVFLAVDERLDRQVAVKAIPRIVYNDIRYRKALEREAKLVMDLHHPCIRAVHNLEEDPQRKAAFLVMEYVEGISLDTLLAYREGEKLDEAEATEIGLQIAEVLAHAHGKGILHRDVKPKNVFLAGLKGDAAALAGPLPPGAISVKLADFGLGTLVRESTSQLSGTDLGTSGTLHYMPPEQIKGAEPSPAMDVYGLGATLYEALAGHVLYPRGEALVQILDMAHKPAPLQGVSPALAAVVDKCLEKDPTRRFQSAEEVKRALGYDVPTPFGQKAEVQPPRSEPNLLRVRQLVGAGTREPERFAVEERQQSSAHPPPKLESASRTPTFHNRQPKVEILFLIATMILGPFSPFLWSFKLGYSRERRLLFSFIFLVTTFGLVMEGTWRGAKGYEDAETLGGLAEPIFFIAYALLSLVVLFFWGWAVQMAIRSYRSARKPAPTSGTGEL